MTGDNQDEPRRQAELLAGHAGQGRSPPLVSDPALVVRGLHRVLSTRSGD